MTMLLVFTVTVLPVSIAFYSDQQLNPEWLTINIVVDCLFLTDVLVNFRTGVFAPDDEVKNRTHHQLASFVLQWNLRIMDTLGTSVLFIGPFFGGRNVWTIYRQFVHCREVVHSSECPLSEFPLCII